MRNLILLIQQYYSFFIFLFLEIICLSIVFSNYSYQQTSYINSARNISGNLYTQKNKLSTFFSLQSVNDSLQKENARLMHALGLRLPSNPLKDTSYSTKRTIDSVTSTIQYRYIPARVLNNSIDQKTNYITLNVGSLQGVKKNMGVISGNGIVGKVSHVSPNYCTVLSLLSEHFVVSALVADGTVGKITWDGLDPSLVLLTGIPQSVKLKKLDSVFTSGYSAFFPEHILIGRAAQVMNGTSYKIWLSTNFRNLHYVYVIEDNTNVERSILEDSTKITL